MASGQELPSGDGETSKVDSLSQSFLGRKMRRLCLVGGRRSDLETTIPPKPISWLLLPEVLEIIFLLLAGVEVSKSEMGTVQRFHYGTPVVGELRNLCPESKLNIQKHYFCGLQGFAASRQAFFLVEVAMRGKHVGLRHGTSQTDSPLKTKIKLFFPSLQLNFGLLATVPRATAQLSSALSCSWFSSFDGGWCDH